VDAILEGMKWVNLDYDEGPIYQTRRFARYAEVVARMLAAGSAYHCYCTREELEAMRAQAQAQGRKPRYDGRCRERAAPRDGVAPVVRFKNPTSGEVVLEDRVKGRIVFANEELDDLIIARSDGTPTYNFTVVVDDVDMNITHVIRGDDHVNNTPRQINIYKALGATLPKFAHVPMILGGDGERLSKRHGAVSVMQYRDEGYLPEALLNYLARLGWSHGDAEKFSREELIEWFDLAHISKSPARFNAEKLAWLNQQYIKEADFKRLAELTGPFLVADGCKLADGPPLVNVVALLKDRANTLRELADAAVLFYRALEPSPALREQHYSAEVRPALADLHARLKSVAWNRAAIHDAIKGVVAAHGLKMPKLAMPLRVMVTGETQTPSIDATLELIGHEHVLARMEAQLKHFPA